MRNKTRFAFRQKSSENFGRVLADASLHQIAGEVSARDQVGVASVFQCTFIGSAYAHLRQLIGHFLSALLKLTVAEWAYEATGVFGLIGSVVGGYGWEALLPLPPADFRADFTPEAWSGVESLLAEAEHVRVVSEGAAREDAYLDCGMETVNHCDVLVAVWDGAAARGRRTRRRCRHVLEGEVLVQRPTCQQGGRCGTERLAHRPHGDLIEVFVPQPDLLPVADDELRRRRLVFETEAIGTLKLQAADRFAGLLAIG